MTAVAEVDHFQTIKAAVDRNSTFFPRRVLGYEPWSGQELIHRAVRKHRRTYCQTGHGIGKTRTIAAIICEWLCNRKNSRVILTATSNEQTKNIVWPEVDRLRNEARVPLGGSFLDKSWEMGPQWSAVRVNPAKPAAMQGFHGENVLVIVDEAEGMNQEMWGAIYSLLSSGNSRLLVCFNPVVAAGHCFRAVARPDLNHVIKLSCLQHPNVITGRNVIPGAVTREWVDEIRAEHGEESAFWQSRVLGEFPTGGAGQIISTGMLMGSEAGTIVVGDLPKRIGVDVAWGGGDYNVLSLLDEKRNLAHQERWKGTGPTKSVETVGRILEAAKRFEVADYNVKVDAAGGGAVIVDLLQGDDFMVDGVQFGGGACGDWVDEDIGMPPADRFLNRRVELYWTARCLLLLKQLGISREYGRAWEDLTAGLYGPDQKNRYVMEKKEDIKKKLGRSPDDGDSIVVALSNMGDDGDGSVMWLN